MGDACCKVQRENIITPQTVTPCKEVREPFNLGKDISGLKVFPCNREGVSVTETSKDRNSTIKCTQLAQNTEHRLTRKKSQEGNLQSFGSSHMIMTGSVCSNNLSIAKAHPQFIAVSSDQKVSSSPGLRTMAARHTSLVQPPHSSPNIQTSRKYSSPQAQEQENNVSEGTRQRKPLDIKYTRSLLTSEITFLSNNKLPPITQRKPKSFSGKAISTRELSSPSARKPVIAQHSSNKISHFGQTSSTRKVQDPRSSRVSPHNSQGQSTPPAMATPGLAIYPPAVSQPKSQHSLFSFPIQSNSTLSQQVLSRKKPELQPPQPPSRSLLTLPIPLANAPVITSPQPLTPSHRESTSEKSFMHESFSSLNDPLQDLQESRRMIPGLTPTAHPVK